MKRLVKSLALAVALLAPTCANAQDKVETTLGADIVSSYIWRGQNLGSGAVQPTLGISWKGLSLSAWGSYGFVNTDDAKELDLSLSYSVAGFTATVTDYYCAAGATDCPGKYFKYNEGHGHVLEGTVGYDFGFLSLNWNTNFFGDDDYASYIDLTVPFKLGIDWEFNAGLVPYKTAYYGNESFTCTNLSVKAMSDIKITDRFSLPVFGQVAANPDNGKFYFAFGVSLGI